MSLPVHEFKTLPDGDASRCEALIWGVPCGYPKQMPCHQVAKPEHPLPAKFVRVDG